MMWIKTNQNDKYVCKTYCSVHKMSPEGYSEEQTESVSHPTFFPLKSC